MMQHYWEAAMGLNKKLIITAILAGTMFLPANSEVLTDVTHPKAPSYRVGISELPENQYVQAQQQRNNSEEKITKINTDQNDNISDRTYADLSIKNLSKEVAQDLEFEEQDMLSDLSLLWQGAAMQSDTINFALYKLANPDADKPDEKSLKKVLTTIASMSTLVGASMGSPILAGSSLIGGNILGIMSQDTKALNYKYTRVNDADMIILIRKVEDLQQNAVNLYYDYMSAKKQLDFATKLVEERQEKFRLAQKNNAARELVVITDAYYRTALDKQRTAKSEFFSKRAALEQFVGNETFLQFEAELLARENGETTKKQEIQPDNNVTEITQEAQTDSNLTPAPDVSDEENILTDNNDEVITGSSSSIENIEDDSDSKKIKHKKQKKEKPAKAEKAQKDQTKGLIFLHNKSNDVQPPENNSQPSQIQDIPVNNLPQQNIKPVDQYGFAPLDEIRVPELKQGGYSIHSELSY